MIAPVTKTLLCSFPDGVIAGFGTKYFSSNNLLTPTVTMQQSHGSTITMVNDMVTSNISSSDGLISALRAVTLVVRTADCAPILFYDPTSGLIGASHQGWKGTIERLQQKMVQKMVKSRADVSTIRAAIGPCIGACCYKMYGERKEMFENSFPAYSSKMFVQNNDDIMLNLTYLNYSLLCEAGLLPNNISYVRACTSCDEKNYYSYNREKVAHSMFSFIRKNT